MSDPAPDDPGPNALPYRLGCPVWACEAWVGSLYTSGARRRWLGEYSAVFGTVEGNTTFYALPTDATVRRWAGEARPGFRFALKTPGEITHERQLAGAQRQVADWIARLRVLQSANVLGPTLVQLPPFFAPSQMGDLERFLTAWPRDLPLAVEPRHEDFFRGDATEDDFDALLCEHGADRALFDSRALFQAPPDDPIEHASQGRKPNPPRRLTVTGDRPFVRFVGRNRLELADRWIAEWADAVAHWVTAGKRPHLFCHAPDDALAPVFAARFHAAVQERLPGLGPLPEWPGAAAPKQQSLF
ncbi:MAG: DUF72 domain-containing protein [Planctomycetota bacterium]